MPLAKLQATHAGYLGPSFILAASYDSMTIVLFIFKDITQTIFCVWLKKISLNTLRHKHRLMLSALIKIQL